MIFYLFLLILINLNLLINLFNMENDFRIFINEIKNFLLQNESLIKWKNSERNKEISEQFNKNKIILKELEQIDFKVHIS